MTKSDFNELFFNLYRCKNAECRSKKSQKIIDALEEIHVSNLPDKNQDFARSIIKEDFIKYSESPESQLCQIDVMRKIHIREIND